MALSMLVPSWSHQMIINQLKHPLRESLEGSRA